MDSRLTDDAFSPVDGARDVASPAAETALTEAGETVSPAGEAPSGDLPSDDAPQGIPTRTELSDEERELYERILNHELSLGLHMPTAQQVAAALAAMALASPAMLGGMPVLPVTLDEQRRRQQEEILQESDSSVGVYQSVQEAATALSLSQRRLAAITREVEGTHVHSVNEADVVHAAKRVMAGEVSPRKRGAFRAALGRVAFDSVDLYILLDDEAHNEELAAYNEEVSAYNETEDDPEDDLEAWLAEFE